MFDYDWGLQDDFMGSALLDLTSLELSRVSELSVPLEDSSRSAGSSADSKSRCRRHKMRFPFDRRNPEKQIILISTSVRPVWIKLKVTLWPRTQEDKEQVSSVGTRFAVAFRTL